LLISVSLVERSDNPITLNDRFSVELSATHVVPEWNNLTQTFPLEEDVYWNEETGGWDWVYGRQEEFWLIRPEVVRECGDWIGRLRKVVSGLGWW
jgi:hypothetical protein